MITLIAMAAAHVAPDAASYRGTAGVCIRWDGPTHIADAVVVTSSGNPALDAGIPATVEAMVWQRPAPPYAGKWVGITIAAAGGPSGMPRPDCDRLPMPTR